MYPMTSGALCCRYKKQQKLCREMYGKNCHMGGFTRLLHSGVQDELSVEVPTFVANPLPNGKTKGYVVSSPKALPP